MRKINFFGMLLALAALTTTSCTKDDDDHDNENEITIQFISPENGGIIDGSNVNILVRLSATLSLYDVELVLHPKGDDDNKLLDIDLHNHVKELDLQETLDLSSFPSGTVFVLEVEAALFDDDHDDDDDHGHDDDEKVEEKIEFTIQ